jgi:hypothetical protein
VVLAGVVAAQRARVERQPLPTAPVASAPAAPG